ncbi:MAG: stage V sporulation protein R, partial [Deltaproteobacteria bacterium]
TFSSTRPEFTIGMFKSHAERVRAYIEDPSIGLRRVESVLDAAHALSLQCRRNLAVRRLDRKAQEERALRAAQPPPDPYRTIHPKREYEEPDLRRVPLEPDEDVLLFIRDHNPFLAPWERDLLTIVHEEAQYFIPQIETKIMNEGWASFWHYQIMNALELPEDMRLEFLVHHHRVLQPHPGGLNPYHLGFTIWKHIYESHGGEGGDLRRPSAGRDALFAVRESERDRSFLRRFLSEQLIRELGLFEYAEKNRDIVVTEVADDEGWEKIRDSLLRSVGMAAVPVIKVLDSDFEGSRALLLGHEYDGRELDLEHAEKTLGFTYRLWGRPVLLDTVIEGTPCYLVFNDEGLSQRKKG